MDYEAMLDWLHLMRDEAQGMTEYCMEEGKPDKAAEWRQDIITIHSIIDAVRLVRDYRE